MVAVSADLFRVAQIWALVSDNFLPTLVVVLAVKGVIWCCGGTGTVMKVDEDKGDGRE